MTQLQPIKAVLFDLDDTLSFTNRDVYRQAAAWVNERTGLDPRFAATAMLAQWTDSANTWQHLRTLDDEERFWREYAQQLAARMQVSLPTAEELLREWPFARFMTSVPGARDVLTALRNRGVKVGVLSNTLPSIDTTLSAVGLNDLVDEAIASCTLGVHKPDPRAFELAARRLDLPPSEVLFVDDKQANVDSARRVGMQALLIDHGGKEPSAIHSLDAILDAL